MNTSHPASDFFDIAYITGADTWSSIPCHRDVVKHLEFLPYDSFILDIGTGRGRLPVLLARHGYKVVATDVSQNALEKAQDFAYDSGQADAIRFVNNPITSLSFSDTSFHAVTEVGVLQHLDPQNFSYALKEVSRVLKPGGLYVSYQFSKQTESFMGFTPGMSPTGSFAVDENVPVHFFEEEELVRTVVKHFTVLSHATTVYTTVDSHHVSLVRVVGRKDS